MSNDKPRVYQSPGDIKNILTFTTFAEKPKKKIKKK